MSRHLQQKPYLHLFFHRLSLALWWWERRANKHVAPAQVPRRPHSPCSWWLHASTNPCLRFAALLHRVDAGWRDLLLPPCKLTNRSPPRRVWPFIKLGAPSLALHQARCAGLARSKSSWGHSFLPFLKLSFSCIDNDPLYSRFFLTYIGDLVKNMVLFLA